MNIITQCLGSVSVNGTVTYLLHKIQAHYYLLCVSIHECIVVTNVFYVFYFHMKNMFFYVFYFVYVFFQ